MVEIRKLLLLPLDDLLVATRKFINPADTGFNHSGAGNGSQFTDHFTSQQKAVTGKHLFDQECAALGIEHPLSPPRHPQTNGRVERFTAVCACVFILGSAYPRSMGLMN